MKIAFDAIQSEREQTVKPDRRLEYVAVPEFLASDGNNNERAGCAAAFASAG